MAERLLSRAAPTGVEYAAALAILGVAGAALYGSHVRHGGLYSDDWAFASVTQQGGGPAALYDALRANVGFRPLGILSLEARFSLFGWHTKWHQAAVLGSTVVLCATLCLTLRTLRMERLHAGTISLLALACPYADATHLWATGSGANLALTLWLLGVLVALRGLDARTPLRRAVLHAVAVALYLASLLQYEVAYVAVCGSGLLYLTRGNWRRVLPRSAADTVVATAAVGVIASQSAVSHAPSYLHHARLMLDGGARILTDVAVPFGRPAMAVVLGVLALVAVAGLVAVGRLPARDPARGDLMRWLIAAGAGIVVAAAGYAMFVAAIYYYQPLATGLANRVNVIAAPGFIITVYSLIAVAGILVARAARGGRLTAVGVTLAGALAILFGFQDRARAHAAVWDRTYRFELWVMGTVKQRLPHPPRSATVYTFGHPVVSENPDLPIFSSFWELRGAIQTMYRDASINAYPALPGTSVTCEARGAYLSGAGYPREFGDRYGDLYLIEVPTGRIARPLSRRVCETVAPTFAPGPLQAPPGG